MAIEGNDDTNNPKTRTLSKLLDEEGGIVLLIWVSGQNEQAEDMLHPKERIPPSKWLATKAEALQNERWNTCNNEMRERKGKTELSKDTEGLGTPAPLMVTL
jgi:hypothetical protein